METMSKRLSQEYKEYQQEFNFADRIVKPHEIDKTIFENDKKLAKGHDALVKSNKSLKKDFKRLEKNIAQGNFKGGRDKGMQRWKESKNIYYMGKKTTGL